jgi:hypothetical protein
VTAAKLPSEMKQPRTWRTRPDPFAEDWPAVTDLLATTPGLQALTVLELLTVKHPGRYDETHLRTLQRRVRRWRAEHGPAREVWFTQAHRPGEAAQTDFTSTAELPEPSLDHAQGVPPETRMLAKECRSPCQGMRRNPARLPSRQESVRDIR